MKDTFSKKKKETEKKNKKKKNKEIRLSGGEILSVKNGIMNSNDQNQFYDHYITQVNTSIKGGEAFLIEHPNH